MLFSQVTFLIFFPIVFLANLLTIRWNLVNRMVLLMAGFVFFAYWSFADFGLMLMVVVGSYVGTRLLDMSDDPVLRRRLLIATVGFDLLCLFYFKYAAFLGHTGAALLSLFHIHVAGKAEPQMLPLGISFYTFHCLSYVADVYKRKFRCASLLTFLIYISLFPQMVAGPIVRGNQLVPQIEANWKMRAFDFRNGAYNFLLGLFLKTVCADHISDIIDPYWTAKGLASLGGAASWIVAFLYSIQIYSDFAGYSLMAIGLGLLLGFRLPDNFRAPYSAATFSEFWRRWHITLSSFLRDYLYIELLGGNRKGARRTYLNLMLTMLLGGLWHGPSWTFVVWGGIHGLALCVERAFGFEGKLPKLRAFGALGWAVVVQVIVVIAWVMFRSPDFQIAGLFVNRMFSSFAGSQVPQALQVGLILTVPAVLHHLLVRAEPVWPWLTAWPVRGVAAGALAGLILMFFHQPQGFIYFTF
jgi:alginate O-acetyltransferase complex protein AlgI